MKRVGRKGKTGGDRERGGEKEERGDGVDDGRDEMEANGEYRTRKVFSYKQSRNK